MYSPGILLFVLAVLPYLCVSGEEAVLKYNTEEFNSKVPQKNHYVMFYAPWASDMKSVGPIWEELAMKYNKQGQLDVKIAKVDCTQETKLCGHQDVTDFPTIKFFRTGGPELGYIYRGVKDMVSIEQFANWMVNRNSEFMYGARVKPIPEREKGLFPLQDENFDDVVENGNAVIKFCTPWSSKCMDLDPVWKKIAEEFQYEAELIVGEVDCTMSKTTCNNNEVRGYPSILWLKDGIVVEKYPTRERDFESLKKYILQKLGKKEATKLTAGLPAEEDPDATSVVTKLEPSNFYEVTGSGNVTFIHFWTPWCSECMTLEVVWEALAEYFIGSELPVVIAKVDCTIQKAFCDEIEVDEFPSIWVYKKGELEHIYAGSKKLDDLIDFVTLAVKTKKPLDEL